MNIAERLKRETAAAHRRIEELVSLEARVACVASYRALIVRFYGFYTEWEPRLATILGADVFDAKRRKIELLRRDLRALGLRSRDIDALPVCPCPIRADESMRALGSMYVLEGATLGSVVIARLVERALGLDGESGCAFFRCYGRDTAWMWRAFGATLIAKSTRSGEDEIVASAEATFEAFGEWMAQAPDHPERLSRRPRRELPSGRIGERCRRS
jgi:heme oxygenase